MGRNKRDHVQEDFYKPFWMGNRQRNPAEMETFHIESMLQRIVGELCVNRFNWKGLPDSVDARFMEVALYQYALVLIIHDNVTDKLFAVRGAPVDGFDMNDNPLAYRIYPLGKGRLPSHLHNKTFSAKAVVPVWANAFRTPDADIVQFYSHRMANTERTIDINLKAARHTKIVAYDENMRLTAENIVRMLDNGDSHIPVTRNMGEDITKVIQVLDMGIHPEQIERLSIVRDRFWSNLMGLLGINNSNQDKKERLVEAEVSGNDDQIGNFRRINLNWRQNAAAKITKKWPQYLPDGVDEVTVDYHTDIDPNRPTFPDEIDGELTEIEIGGDVSNGDVHN